METGFNTLGIYHSMSVNLVLVSSIKTVAYASFWSVHMLRLCDVLHTVSNKKLGCRRETARRFMSLNILLSQSRSFEMTMLSRACKSLLVFHRHYIYVVPFLRCSASKNGVTLQLGVPG